eukprot:CAMPEP_0172786938 /NCGR_PEP_ID=MMETSP1074-20121228/206201_1 /TAXON_ID=2916 /ORGANISM="Ceratium fusus, Strain PA161109" /LENGTH=66 /DNA_ID=CAMNT_0013623957 /DNA_START=192 /DNA_END=392 /DNA_ORIENTATION=+
MRRRKADIPHVALADKYHHKIAYLVEPENNIQDGEYDAREVGHVQAFFLPCPYLILLVSQPDMFVF